MNETDSEAYVEHATNQPARLYPEQETPPLQPGDTVTIFRQLLGGRFCIEGRAKLVKPSDWSEDHWVVTFIEPGFSKRKVTRFVDEYGQNNPEAHVDEMNRIAGFAEEAK